MATYYIRKTGSDGAAGTSAGTAWLTVGKALGASGIASGDTVYIGAGVYREVITVAMTSATVETKVYGDVDGVQTGDAGEVQVTAYTTSDTTAPSSSSLLNLAGRDYLTFQDIVFISGTASVVLATTTTPTNITFRRCYFFVSGTASGSGIAATCAADIAFNWVVDSCIFFKMTAVSIIVNFTTSAIADYDGNFVIKNCLFIGGTGTCVQGQATGAAAFKGGGVDIRNCTNIGGLLCTTNTASISTTYPLKVYNCFSYSGSVSTLNANTTGQIVEDYNILNHGATPRVNVTAGTHSVSDASYAALFYSGHEFYSVGSNLKPFGMPKAGSPWLGYGNQASSPTVDILGVTRPALASVGCYEIGNTAVRETTTKRTGSNAIKILNAGYQDFVIPVSASATTINIYAQYNSAYAGTLPSMSIVNGTEAGVASATATQAGAANTWELLTLSFTPTSAGIITIRLSCQTTAVTGAAFFDDFSIT